MPLRFTGERWTLAVPVDVGGVSAETFAETVDPAAVAESDRQPRGYGPSCRAVWIPGD